METSVEFTDEGLDRKLKCTPYKFTKSDTAFPLLIGKEV